MDALCFSTSWATGRLLNRVQYSPTSLCTHRMTLISHEKLEDIFGEGDDAISKYNFHLEIPGSYSRDLRKKSVASLKKNSAFKGFRKGTIPPFIRKDIDGFVLQDSISDMISNACTELGLKPVEGDASEPEMDLEEIKSRFKVGTDFQFTCSLALERESPLENEGFMEADAKEVEEDAPVASS